MQVLRKSAMFAAVVLGTFALAQAEGIAWLRSYEMALQQAKESSKLVMINFYTDW